LVGKVAKVKDDGEVMVEIADNVQVRVLKSTLTEVRSKGEKAES
jgi:preprotein translocase subunit YajC